MKANKTLLFLATAAMSVGLFASCGKKSGGGSSGSKEKEVSYEKYMEETSRLDYENFPYQICYVDGSLTGDGEEEPEIVFENEPVRFKEAHSPIGRPQVIDELSRYTFNDMFRPANGWEDSRGNRYYINKKDNDHKFKVVTTIEVSIDNEAEFTYTYNQYGFATSVKSSESHPKTDKARMQLLEDITFNWQEVDKLGEYTAVTFEQFKADALEKEAKEHPYKSARVSGTARKIGSGEPALVFNGEVLVKGEHSFYSPRYGEALSEASRKASTIANYSTYFFYKSETLDSLMAIMEMASGTNVIERVVVWNQYGLITSATDKLYGADVENRFSGLYEYHTTISYSQDEATVRITILPGLGRWADGATSKVFDVPYGSYLANIFPVGYQAPTAEGYRQYTSYFADETGKLIHLSTTLLGDMTLTYPFYKGNTPTQFTIRAYPGKSYKVFMQGYESNEPMIVYGDNGGYYFLDGASREVTMTVPETTGLFVNLNHFVYNANIAFSDKNGMLAEGNSMITVFTVGPQAVVFDYACYQLTNLQTISVNARCFENIGKHAFDGCTSLTECYSSAINFGEAAFKGCSNLGSTLNLSETVNIGAGAFEGCESLHLLVPGTVAYDDTYSQNRFIKRNQTFPETWAEDWQGDAIVHYILTLDDFTHESSHVPVGGSVGGVTGTVCFSIYLPGETTYSVRLCAFGSNIVTLLDSGDNILGKTDSTNYDVTISDVSTGTYGGYVIIQIVPTSDASAEYQLDITVNE